MLLHITIPTIIAVPHHIPMLDTLPRTIKEPAATPAMNPAAHPAMTPSYMPPAAMSIAHPAMATVTETTMPHTHTTLLHTTIPTIIAVPHLIHMLDTPPRTMSIKAIEES